MHFLDNSLLPENQQKLVIQVAPYGPQWLPGDFPEDIPVSFADQVQKAVDCYNAGATMLHVHLPRSGWQGLQAAQRLQRNARSPEDGGAEDGAAGRRLDLVRARRRRH